MIYVWIHRIVIAAVGLILYELFALGTHRCETLTDHARKRDRMGVVSIGYAVWLLIHLLTGGRV
jgi:hypothetical protein